MADGKKTAVKLRFCPESNDLLQPKEFISGDKRKLVYACRNCNHTARLRFLFPKLLNQLREFVRKPKFVCNAVACKRYLAGFGYQGVNKLCAFACAFCV